MVLMLLLLLLLLMLMMLMLITTTAHEALGLQGVCDTRAWRIDRRVAAHKSVRGVRRDARSAPRAAPRASRVVRRFARFGAVLFGAVL